MKKKSLAIGIALVIVATGLPAVQAKHLSVGWSDSVGMDAEETPEDPSVPEGDYRVGTSRDCYEPDTKNRSVDEIERARTSDAFCGKLIYHEGTPFENVAPPDQQLNGPIGEFDVIRSAQPYGFEICWPWCPSNPVGQTAFETFHELGAEMGLTDNSSQASKKDGDHDQAYSLAPSFPTASHLVHRTNDAWRMNGWDHPQPYTDTFVGFLYDDDGDPIDEERLASIVQTHEQKFPDGASIENAICGFTPYNFESDFGIVSSFYIPNADGWCDLYFEWIEASGGDADFRDGYGDRCESPTYVCGATQSSWKATDTCFGFDGCTGSGTKASEVDYSVWHWVVAPVRSACNGDQEPGVRFQTGGSWDYLAHDLDVWTPATSLNAVNNSEGVHHLPAYTGGIPDPSLGELLRITEENTTKALEEVDEATRPVQELAENVTDELPGVPSPPESFTQLLDVGKDSRVEPNHDPDDLALMGLSEGSQTKSWARESPDVDSCTAFFDDTEEYIDPWVNIIDMNTVSTGIAGGFFVSGAPALYGTGADHQDRVNRPTTGSMYFEGKLGMFTDKDDIGEYDRPAFPTNDGAHSLYWDMHVNDNGGIDTDAGCQFEEGKRLVEAMQEAHYGPRTGLVLAVYLEEPTAVYDHASLTTIPFPAGETIFVHESQALTQLRQQGDPRVEAFGERVTEGMQEHPDIADEAQIVYLNDELGRGSSFPDQCGTFQTGGFRTGVTLVHQCETGCEGDTIVTGYMVESTHPDFQIGADRGSIPLLEFANGEVFGLDQRVETWLDVDPFDNDPDRNREESSAPPH